MTRQNLILISQNLNHIHLIGNNNNNMIKKYTSIGKFLNFGRIKKIQGFKIRGKLKTKKNQRFEIK